MTYSELYNKWLIKMNSKDIIFEFISDLQKLRDNNIIIHQDDLLCNNKISMSYLTSNGEHYRVKVKKVKND